MADHPEGPAETQRLYNAIMDWLSYNNGLATPLAIELNIMVPTTRDAAVLMMNIKQGMKVTEMMEARFFDNEFTYANRMRVRIRSMYEIHERWRRLGVR